MKKWYFDMSDFKPEKGFEFSFEGRNEEENKTFVHLCKVTEVTDKKKLAYSWRYKDLPGVTLVTFELFPDGSNTLLRLTHEGIESLAPGGRLCCIAARLHSGEALGPYGENGRY